MRTWLLRAWSRKRTSLWDWVKSSTIRSTSSACRRRWSSWKRKITVREKKIGKLSSTNSMFDRLKMIRQSFRLDGEKNLSLFEIVDDRHLTFFHQAIENRAVGLNCSQVNLNFFEFASERIDFFAFQFRFNFQFFFESFDFSDEHFALLWMTFVTFYEFDSFLDQIFETENKKEKFFFSNRKISLLFDFLSLRRKFSLKFVANICRSFEFVQFFVDRFDQRMQRFDLLSHRLQSWMNFCYFPRRNLTMNFDFFGKVFNRSFQNFETIRKRFSWFVQTFKFTKLQKINETNIFNEKSATKA